VSQENVELVRRLLALANAGEEEAATNLLAPDVEWVVAREHPEARTIVGRQGVANYLQTWEEMMPDLDLRLDRVVDIDDTVVGIGSVRGAGLTSGAEVGVPIALLFTLKNGVVVGVEEYLNPSEALKTAGLEE
jgi:ketosteroid isomerase-like protein